ncbi:MAG: alcohol dehydrogenase [Deltaproteobacteria bacterium HGW-Deltaproteobacteria-12]|jgi:aryl-alcohol dehydrogenase|nr:MAG: alcohol dehydrogenase [Deltaproteobacteria bacterium HGW-Deltaproteobacteria-12]
MKITAAVIRGMEKEDPFLIEELELDEPREHEVVVRIAGVGMCHTDLFSKISLGMLPMVLGHEGSGVVEKVGSAVTKVEPGDHVVMSFGYCGKCHNCLSSHPAFCMEFAIHNASGGREDGSFTLRTADEDVFGNFFAQSSFASHALAHEKTLVKVDKDVPIELLGPLGCGIQTGAGTVINALKARPGESIAIFGAGTVGLSAILAAVVCGCTKIVAVDILPERLELAKKLGATHLINSKEEDAVDVINKITTNVGVDYSIECTSNAIVARQAVDAVRILGTCALVGVTMLGDELTVDWSNVAAGRIVRGVYEGDSQPDIFIPQLIDLFKAGRFPFDKLISYRPLSEINESVEDTHSGKAVKVILKP